MYDNDLEQSEAHESTTDRPDFAVHSSEDHNRLIKDFAGKTSTASSFLPDLEIGETASGEKSTSKTTENAAKQSFGTDNQPVHKPQSKTTGDAPASGGTSLAKPVEKGAEKPLDGKLIDKPVVSAKPAIDKPQPDKPQADKPIEKPLPQKPVQTQLDYNLSQAGQDAHSAASQQGMAAMERQRQEEEHRGIRRYQGEAVSLTQTDATTGQLQRAECSNGRVFTPNGIETLRQHGTTAEQMTGAVWQAAGHSLWTITDRGGGLRVVADVRVSENGDLGYVPLDGGGRRIEETRDGRYFVTHDGVRREYAPSHRFESTPCAPDPGHYPHPHHPLHNHQIGGQVVNETANPILVLGNGQAADGGNHGAMCAYVLRPGERNNPITSDVDGVVIDPRFQPIYTHNGTVLVPREIPIDARVVKISDTVRLTATGTAANLDWSTNQLWLMRTEGTLSSTNLSGQQPVRPEAPRPRR